jgi:ABC-type long-subunit fatty acid transport system fused permease/ATPase subunit
MFVPYLVNSWTTIVELISIYKRLRAFEHRIGGTRELVGDRGGRAHRQ